MITSRRILLIASIAALTVSACGQSNDTLSSPDGSGPRVIVINPGSGTSGRESVASDQPESDKMFAAFQNITYVVNGELTSMPASARAWLLPAGQQPDEARVRRIADLFGVTGDITQYPAEQGGGWLVGPSDYSQPTLSIGTDGMLSWWYSPVYSDVASSCAIAIDEVLGDSVVAIEEPAPADTAPPATEPAYREPSDTEPANDAPVEVCEPEAPRGVPTGDEAEAAARELFASMGYDVSQFEFDVYADKWSANVTAYRLLDGIRSPLSLSVGYGADAAITWAGGFLAEPVAQDDYPLVSVDDALVRLQDQDMWWGYGPMARTAGAVDDVTALPVECDPSSCTVEPLPIEPDSGDAIEPTPLPEPLPADDVPIDEMPVEEITVTIDGVRQDLWMQWEDDGSILLVPAFSFTSADGGVYTVIAVDDALLDMPGDEPVAPPVEPPVEPAPPVDPAPLPTDTTAAAEPAEPSADCPALPTEERLFPIEEISTVIVGACFDDAVAFAANNGVTVRAIEIDGVPQAVTADLRTDRLNVPVNDGVITAVGEIG
jgi:hypothetical protein